MLLTRVALGEWGQHSSSDLRLTKKETKLTRNALCVRKPNLDSRARVDRLVTSLDSGKVRFVIVLRVVPPDGLASSLLRDPLRDGALLDGLRSGLLDAGHFSRGGGLPADEEVTDLAAAHEGRVSCKDHPRKREKEIKTDLST